MLVFIKCFGEDLNETVCADLLPNTTVAQLKAMILKMRPRVVINRLLFAGKQLDDDNQTITFYDITKESTIQLMGKQTPAIAAAGGAAAAPVAAAAAGGGAAPAPAPSLIRQPTAGAVSHGDVLIVYLKTARNLIPADWNGLSDPYCIFCLDKQTSRSTIKPETLNPTWDEYFAFWIDPSIDEAKQSLSVICNDHDTITADDPLGTFDVSLAKLPRDQTTEKFYTLAGVKSGEVCLSIRRAALTSPELKEVLIKLVGKPFTAADLASHNVSLDQFLGFTPFILPPAPGSHDVPVNPALQRLKTLLKAGTFELSKASDGRTIAKVLRILESQKAVVTRDKPSKFLWIDTPNDERKTYNLLQSVCPGRVKTVFKTGAGPAFTVFKSVEDATVTLIDLSAHGLGLTGFGHRVLPGDAFAQSPVSGFLSISGPHPYDELKDKDTTRRQNAEWRHHWCVIQSVPAPAAPVRATSASVAPPAPTPAVSAVPPALAATPMGAAGAAVASSAPPAAAGASALVSSPAATPAAGSGALVYTLQAFAMLTDDKPSISVPLSKQSCLLLRTGAWSMELVDLGAKTCYYFTHPSKLPIDNWYTVLKDTRAVSAAVPVPVPVPIASAAGASASSPPPTSILLERKSTAGDSHGRTVSVSGNRPVLPPVIPPVAGAHRVSCTMCKAEKSIGEFYSLDRHLHDTVRTRSESNAASPHLRKESSADSPASPRSASASTAVVPNSPQSAASAAAAAASEAAAAATRPPACRACLISYAMSKIDNRKSNELADQFTIGDLTDLLSPAQLTTYLDSTLRDFLNAGSNSKKFMTCPKCTCAMEVDYHSWATRSSTEEYLKRAVGLDNEPITAAAQRHFLNFRFLCRGCNATFCKSCKLFPYHTGFDCKEYQEFKNAPKCRFCGGAVTNKSRIKYPPSKALEITCGKQECAGKAAKSCRLFLPCGHPCCGIAEEKVCPPCMVDDCKTGHLADVHAVGSDQCAICFTEELHEAPIVVLESCKHVFHEHCIKQRLDKKWNGARIEFGFMGCALCKKVVKHPALDASVAPLLDLEKRVTALSMEKLKFEQLDKDKAITDKKSPFFGKPEAYAVDHYMFYQCYDCKNPYFAGARACGANAGEEVRRQELLCSACQKVESLDTCKTHGDAFLIFKCRFCCNFSQWFCFASTHFCDSCHQYGTWPALVDSSGGKNKKKIPEYPQCKSLMAKIKEVEKDKSYKSDDDRHKAYSKLFCDPKECPLNIRHPPNGFEFGIGCGMCKPKEPEVVDEAELERRRVAKEKEKEKAKHEAATRTFAVPNAAAAGGDEKKAAQLSRAVVSKPSETESKVGVKSIEMRNGWVTIQASAACHALANPLTEGKYWYQFAVSSTSVEASGHDTDTESDSDSDSDEPGTETKSESKTVLSTVSETKEPVPIASASGASGGAPVASATPAGGPPMLVTAESDLQPGGGGGSGSAADAAEFNPNAIASPRNMTPEQAEKNERERKKAAQRVIEREKRRAAAKAQKLLSGFGVVVGVLSTRPDEQQPGSSSAFNPDERDVSKVWQNGFAYGFDGTFYRPNGVTRNVAAANAIGEARHRLVAGDVLGVSIEMKKKSKDGKDEKDEKKGGAADEEAIITFYRNGFLIPTAAAGGESHHLKIALDSISAWTLAVSVRGPTEVTLNRSVRTNSAFTWRFTDSVLPAGVNEDAPAAYGRSNNNLLKWVPDDPTIAAPTDGKSDEPDSDGGSGNGDPSEPKSWNLYPLPGKGGEVEGKSSWKLVRRVKAGTRWHAANDNLAGTAVYGYPTGPQTQNDFSIRWADTPFDYMMIATGDYSQWVLLAKGAIGKPQAGVSILRITASNLNASPHSVNYFNRPNCTEDPWYCRTVTHELSGISTEDHNARGCSAQNDKYDHSMLYGEDSYAGGWKYWLINNKGSNVWIHRTKPEWGGRGGAASGGAAERRKSGVRFDADVKLAVKAKEPENKNDWTCERCTFAENKWTSKNCELCDTKRPPRAPVAPPAPPMLLSDALAAAPVAPAAPAAPDASDSKDAKSAPASDAKSAGAGAAAEKKAKPIRMVASIPGGNGCFLRFVQPQTIGGGVRYLNTYTLVMDVRFPALAGKVALARMNSEHGACTFYMDQSGNIGSATVFNYSADAAKVVPNKWERVAISVDLRAKTLRTFVNGKLSTGSFQPNQLDENKTFSLDAKEFKLFYSTSRFEMNATKHLRACQLYGRALSNAEIAALGGAGGARGTQWKKLSSDLPNKVLPSHHQMVSLNGQLWYIDRQSRLVRIDLKSPPYAGGDGKDGKDQKNGDVKEERPVTVIPIPDKYVAASCGLVSYDNSLWLFAGNKPGKTPVTRYTPSTGEWKAIETGGVGPSISWKVNCVVVNDLCLMFGGVGTKLTTIKDIWRFDFPTSKWSLVSKFGSVNPICSNGGAVSLVDTSLFVVGGTPYAYESSVCNDHVFEFKFTDSTYTGGRWLNRSYVQNKPSARAFFGGALSGSKEMYCFGGLVTGGVDNSMFAFNPRTLTWRRVTFDDVTFPTARSYAAFGILTLPLGDVFVTASGKTHDGTILDDIQFIDPKSALTGGGRKHKHK